LLIATKAQQPLLFAQNFFLSISQFSQTFPGSSAPQYPLIGEALELFTDTSPNRSRQLPTTAFIMVTKVGINGFGRIGRIVSAQRLCK
jgi:hypothetical protein